MNQIRSGAGLATALLLAGTGIVSGSPPAPVRYEISLEPGEARVAIGWPRLAVDSLVLELPPWAGVDLAAGVGQVVARDEAGEELPVRRSGPDSWVVAGTANRAFRVEYAIQGERESLAGGGRENLFRPALLPTWAYAWGHALVLQAAQGTAWRDLPVELALRSRQYASPRATTPAGRLSDVGALRDALLVAGEFHEHTLDIRGVPIRVLVHVGSWGFSEVEFVSAVRRIAEAQSMLLRHPPPQPGTIVLVEGSPQSSGGTVSGTTMAVYPNPARPLTGAGVETLRLIAHEQFHVWNGSLIEPDGSVGEGYYKWFQEGLTEYYAWNSLLKAGLVDAAGFTTAINRALREFEENSVAGTATAARLAECYWTTPACQRLPYVKGLLLGLLTDLTLRREGGERATLDAVMRQVIAATNDGDRPYTDRVLRGALRAVGGPVWDTRYEAQMLGAGALPLEGLCGAGAFTCERQQVDLFDLGVTTDSGRVTGGAVVTAVGPQAATGGIQVGDQLTGGMSIYFGDPSREAMLEVRRGGEVIKARYRPVRQAPVLQLVADAAAERVVEALGAGG